jgi:hypothetical protein
MSAFDPAGATPDWRGERGFAYPHYWDQDTEQFSVAERKERLDAAISEALQREAARHDAAVKNMQRLRALRLERDQKAKRK